MLRSNKFVSALTAGAIFVSSISISYPIFASSADKDEIFISSAEEMAEFSENCRLDSWSKGKNVTLTADINLTDIDFEPVPIFSGTFNGAGHTIKGLRLEKTGSNIGLFRYVGAGGMVEDLNVQAIITPGGSAGKAGGIIGTNSGTVRNCTFLGTVRGESEIGGIVGRNSETGSVIGCSVKGYIYGKNAAGGISGYNSGILLKCENSAGVNLTNADTSLNLTVIDPEVILEQYRFSDEKSEKELLDNCSDSGGIAGYSDGIVQSCINRGNIGYPHVGYNMGGVVGRQSGYLAGCSNFGTVNGRKDVGGIVGQSEPYLTIEPQKATLEQIRTELRALNDLIDKTLNDVQSTGDNVSDSFSLMKEYTDTAEESCKKMLDGVTDFVNGNVEIINTTSADITNALDKIVPAMDELAGAGKSMSDASEQLGMSVDYLKDIADVSDIAMKDVKDSLQKLKIASDNLVSASDGMKKAAEVLNDDIVWDLREMLSLAYNDLHNASETLNDYLNELIEALKDFFDALSAAGLDDFRPTAVNAFADELSPLASDENGEEGSVSVTSESDAAYTTDDTGDEYVSEETEEVRQPEEPNEPNYPGEPDGTENPDNPDKPEIPIIPDFPEPPRIPAAPDISISTDDYKRIIDSLNYSWDIVGDALKSSADSFGTAAENLKNAFSDLEAAAEKLDPVSDDINNALDKFKTATDAVSAMGKTLQSSFTAFGGAVRELTEGGPKEFRILGDDFKRAGNTLHEAVIAITDNAEKLNNELDHGSGVVADDLRAVNAQLEIVSELVLNTVSDLKDDIYSPSVGDTLQDTSDEDISATRQGKVTDCVNKGEVIGDRNVGGIVGALAIEFDLDPESDLTDDIRFGATYETKAVIQTGRNYGSVTAKKDCVGGVVGQMELGTTIYCQNYGNVTSSGGSYVGGIAGRSEAMVRSCYAKSVLSGDCYIGGITGWASRLRGCCSIATIKEGGEYIGAVSGAVQTDGVLNNNLFVDTGTAGVDGVSYAGRAEPIEFSELVKKEGLPKELTDFNLILTADEKTVEKIPFSYGDDLSKLDLPEVPEKNGCFGRWGDFDTSGLMSDITLEAVYSPWITITASAEAEGKLALALAEGKFTDLAELHANESTSQSPFEADEDTAVLDISLTGTELSDSDTVPIRLLNKSGKKATVMKLVGDKWQKVNHTENGSYLIVDMNGTKGTFCIRPDNGNTAVITAASAAAIMAAVTVIIIIFTLKKKKSAGSETKSVPTITRKRK